jgi:hypothetical protein
MNDNRAHAYENYKNSYGMQEIQREASQARMLKDAGSDMPKVKKVKQGILRLVPIAIVVLWLLFYLN